MFAHRFLPMGLLAAFLILAPGAAHAQSTTTFTYQGYLEDGGSPATGPVDLRFILYDSESGGDQVGSTLTKDDVSVTDGVFAVDLDFGAVFGDGMRWLEIGVRDGGSTSDYTTLSPREALRPTPTAIAASTLQLPFAATTTSEFAAIDIKQEGDASAIAARGQGTGFDFTIRATNTQGSAAGFGVNGEVIGSSPVTPTAVYGKADGTKQGAFFGAEDGNAIFGQIKGSGKAGYFRVFSGTGIPLVASQSGDGSDIAVFQKGGFDVARIDEDGNGYFSGLGVGVDTRDAQLHAENNAGSGLTTPTLRAENLSTSAGVAGYFITNGTDATMVLANRDGNGQLLKGFGSNGGNREFEIRNDGSMDFYSGNDRTVHIDAPNGNVNIDGSFSSSGADYAELLPRRHPAESVRPGDLVAVTGGEITKTTADADRLMIVSTDPAILGNNDDARAQADHSPVAFLGQVPVRVRGPVAVGELLVASGQHDGTARAVSPADWDPARHGPIAGRAWSMKSGAGPGTVIASVGLPQTGALVERLQRQQSRIDALEDRLERIEAALPTAGVSTQE